MHWGNLLLDGLFGISWDDVKAGLSSVVYWLRNLFPSLFYNIWRLLAYVVNVIEGIFRRLAGLGSVDISYTASNGGTAYAHDMVEAIIFNKQVQQIFGNLVALSTALIVFFTIIKIIQDHYKTNDGGSPYKVVIKAFKGLMMFFFVNAAVIVGLYASGVVFRGLDAATGSGSASIAGQIFKSMAAPANRKLLGSNSIQDDAWYSLAYNRFNDRLDGKKIVTDDGKYFITEVKNKNSGITDAVSTQSLSQQFLEAFPALRYGIVGKDNKTVTPLAQWLNTAESNVINGLQDRFGDWSNSFDNGNGDWDFDDGKIGGTVGYGNDILRAFDVSITPSIDLKWSPVDIDVFMYKLGQDHYVDHPISVPFLGTEIPAGTYYYKFNQPVPLTKDISESAKQFGITLNAGVALQDGSASASFSLDAPIMKNFDNILLSVLVNVLYTNILTITLNVIPALPAVTHFAGQAFPYFSLITPIIADFMQDMSDDLIRDMVPAKLDEKGEKVLDENGNPIPMVEPFSKTSHDHSAGIWVTMDPKSPYFDTRIEQYRIDANFEELWGQLTDHFDAIREGLTEKWDNALPEIDRMANDIAGVSNRVLQQNKKWMPYKTKVDQYNDLAASSLTELGNLFRLWEIVGKLSDENARKDKLANENYNGSFSDLEERIVEVWSKLASAYRNDIKNKKPADSKADLRITPAIYKPIIQADSINLSTATNIFNFLKTSPYAKVNLEIHDDKAYRMIDWDAYGFSASVDNILKNTTDIYLTASGIYKGELVQNTVDPETKRTKTGGIIAENSLTSLPCMDLTVNNDGDWDAKGGISFFTSHHDDNKFKTSQTTNNLMEGYWGYDGIHILDNQGNDHCWVFNYDGDTLSIFTANNMTPTHTINGQAVGNGSSASVIPASTVVSSSTARSVGLQTQNAQINGLTSKSSQKTMKENEFSKQIIRFRKLRTAADQPVDHSEDDILALEGWVQTTPSARPGGKNHQEYMLHSMNSTQIDDFMASNNGDARRYLMITTAGTANHYENGMYNWGDYIGKMSWDDSKTVNALYDIGSINFGVGFIAVIAAAGVYLNFALGLIQRAVNMAVLYIMSPITISFYPFDDGKKFSSNFVMPFYKEAIGAFAVIISLNIFIVLMAPLQNAVEAAVGEALGWLALVAFVGMLPGIRDSINGIFGANMIKSKSFTDAFKDARGVMGQAFTDLNSGLGTGKKLLKKGVHGAAMLRGAIDRHQGRKKARQDEEMKRLSKLREDNQLGWWGARRLAKLEGAKKTQEDIDAVHKKLKEAKSNEERDEIISTSNLSPIQKKRLERQQQAADNKARKNLKKRGIAENDPNYKAQLAAEKENLLKDEKFKKSVNSTVLEKVAKGIVTAPFKPAAVAFKLTGTAAKGFGTAVKAVGKTFAESEFGHDLIYRAKNSVLGDLVGARFGEGGTAEQDKDSVAGELRRWFNATARGEARKKSGEEFNELLKKKNEIVEPVNQAVNVDGVQFTEANELKGDWVKESVAQGKIASLSTKDRYIELKTDEYVRKGMSEIDARNSATSDANGFLLYSDLLKEYEKLGGDAKLATGVAKGWKGLSIAIDPNDAAMQQLLQDADSDFMQNVKLSDADINGLIAEAGQNNDTATVAKLNAVKEYKKKMKKIKDTYNDKIGEYVPKENSEELFNFVAKVYDTSFSSSDPESLGYKQNQILQSYAQSGGLDNPECRREMEKCEREMKEQLSQLQDRFVQENRSALIKWNATKSISDSRNSAEKVGLAEEKLNQRNFVMRAMPELVRQLLFKDGHIRKRHIDDIDYAGVARECLLLVDAIEKHDFEAAKKFGFDESTVKQLIEWELNGKTENLSHFKKMAQWDAANMGSYLDDMKDSGLLGAENLLRNMVALEEAQENIAKAQAVARANDENENRLRESIDRELSSIPEIFNKDRFKDLWRAKFGQIKDMQGEIIRSSESLVSALQGMLNHVNNTGELTSEIREMMAAMDKMRAKSPNDVALNEMISGFTDNINNAVAAGKSFANVQANRALISDIQNKIAEILKKMGLEPGAGN